MQERAQNAARLCGLLAVGTFAASFLTFASLTPDFDWLNDYISMLGARGAPYATAWNISGFVIPGLLLAIFGATLGLSLKDRISGACLVVAGLGFAVAAAPTDPMDANATLSKAHFASICISLAGWCGTLARVSSMDRIDVRIRYWTSRASLLVFLPVMLVAAELVSPPLAHRLILLIIFGWISAVALLQSDKALTESTVPRQHSVEQ